MASTITLALRTAQSGLLVNQQALDSISNNIANVNSPSYSRKVVQVEQRVVGGSGAGVQISDVNRQVDEGLLKSLRLETSTYNRLDVQGSYYDRLQDLFGNPADNTSIAHILNDFAAAIENLAVSPDKSLNQSEVIRQGQQVALKLQTMSTTIQDLRVQADSDISSNVDTINQLTAKIADLNDKIIRNNALTADVSDLRDQRDQSIDELSQLIDIRYFYRADGDAVVFTSAGRTLVDNVAFTLSHSAASSLTPTSTHAEGDIGGIYIGAAIPGNDITGEVSGGKLGGLIEMRDQTLTDLQSQLDELASTLRDSVNQIHNSGVPFPGLQSVTGTRHFLDTSNAVNDRSQSITFSGNDDTRVVLTDSDGNQQATTTIRGILGSNTTTIGNLTTQLQTWLQGNGASGATVSIDSTGRLAIELNSSTVYLGFRDETSSTAGSTHEDATINFDADGDGNTDETVDGFSNFFGLNDFFVDGLGLNVHESNVVSKNFTAPAATTLSFVDGTSDLPLHSTNAVTLSISSGDSLADIAAAITNDVPNLTATVVPDGSGQRLRISHDDGIDFEITETGAGNLLSTLGMHNADTRTASQLSVRSDIIDTPSLISSGTLQWNSDLGTGGEYYSSVGDDTTMQALSSSLNSATSFDTAGGLAGYNLSFANYAGAVLATNASNADNNSTQTDREQALTQSLQTKSDNIRGVNLDEEMAELIRYQQAYSAAARVINVIQNMFDVLNQSVG